MKYIPDGHIKVPSIKHQWVRVADLSQKVKQCVWVNKHLYSDGDKDAKIYEKNRVDACYVKSSETYQYNLDALHGYIMDIYYVVSHYLSDAEISKVFDALYGGGTHIWHQWIAIDMLASQNFSSRHVKTLKALMYILSSPHLKFKRNHKCERWFEEERINLSEVRNVFLKEERKSA